MANKKLEDLTAKEAKSNIANLKLRKKAIQIKIIGYKNEKKLRSIEKRLLKEQKTSKLKTIQNQINATSSKVSKDLKRKSKARESSNFDSRIASKDRQIDQVENKISIAQQEIKEIELFILALQKHINSK